MHPARAFRVLNLLDVPENRRKFWPQQACVIIDAQTHQILDVVQLYNDVFTESEQYQKLYPGSIAFFCRVGDFKSVRGLESKIEWCFEDDGTTYVLGKGFVAGTKPETMAKRRMT